MIQCKSLSRVKLFVPVAVVATMASCSNGPYSDVPLTPFNPGGQTLPKAL